MTSEPRAMQEVTTAIAQLRLGRPIVVVDEDACREGNLVFAAEFATAELVSFVVRHTSGFLCVSLDNADANRLNLPPLRRVNQDRDGTAYAVSVSAREGITNGISAPDRARTMRLLADANTLATELTRPGHVVPLRTEPGGVLSRAGRTEAAMDLMRLAGLRPAAGLCQIVSVKNPTQMAGGSEVSEFCQEHGLAMVHIQSLINYRRRTESILSDRVDARMPLATGSFAAVCHTAVDGREHLALVHGEIGQGYDVLVRIHEECLLGDIFGSTDCTCGADLHAALGVVVNEGRGVVVYLRRREGQVASVLDKLAMTPPDQRAMLPAGTPFADEDIRISAQILADLGVRSIRLLASDLGARSAFEQHGIRVTEQIPLYRATRRSSSLPTALAQIPAVRRFAAGI